MHLQEVDHAVILTRKLSLCGAAARMYSTAGKEKIAMIGSGNFGSALVRILGRNALDKPETFDPKVSMYVHEEMIDGKPLTQIINETNENVKYLKGAKFTPNVVAEPSLEKAVEGATMVCFCLPHQFLKPLMPAIKVTDAVRQPVRGAAGGGWRWRRRWRQQLAGGSAVCGQGTIRSDARASDHPPPCNCRPPSPRAPRRSLPSRASTSMTRVRAPPTCTGTCHVHGTCSMCPAVACCPSASAPTRCDARRRHRAHLGHHPQGARRRLLCAHGSQRARSAPRPHAAPYTQRAPASLLAHVAGRARVPAASQPGRRHLPTLWPRTDSCG